MTIEQLQDLIKGYETRTLELKKTTGELKDAMRTACAFLNTGGGWLIYRQGEMTTTIVFERPNVVQSVVQNVVQTTNLEKLSSRAQSIIRLITNNERISIEEIASELSVSTRTIDRDLREIKKVIFLRWEGSARKGKWIIEKNNNQNKES